MNIRERITAATGAFVLGAAGVLAALTRGGATELRPQPDVPRAEPRRAQWAVGPVSIVPGPGGAEVRAEVTNLAGHYREGVFTLVILTHDGERLATIPGIAVLGPGETRMVDFPGTEDFMALRGRPLRYQFEVNA